MITASFSRISKICKKLGRAIVRQFEIRGIPVNKKKCKIIPLTKPFRWCKARFTLTETRENQSQW